jgi:hypothetical protein
MDRIKWMIAESAKKRRREEGSALEMGQNGSYVKGCPRYIYTALVKLDSSIG